MQIKEIKKNNKIIYQVKGAYPNNGDYDPINILTFIDNYKKIIEARIYLDYINNFISVEAMAEYYQTNIEVLNNIINEVKPFN